MLPLDKNVENNNNIITLTTTYLSVDLRFCKKITGVKKPNKVNKIKVTKYFRTVTSE